MFTNEYLYWLSDAMFAWVNGHVNHMSFQEYLNAITE